MAATAAIRWVGPHRSSRNPTLPPGQKALSNVAQSAASSMKPGARRTQSPRREVVSAAKLHDYFRW